MSPREGVIYGSWIAGIIIVFTIGSFFGLPRIANLILGLLLGGGLSLFIEKFYLGDEKKSPPTESPYSDGPSERPLDDPDQVSCPNPKCSWSGKSGYHVYCPKCDTRLY